MIYLVVYASHDGKDYSEYIRARNERDLMRKAKKLIYKKDDRDRIKSFRVIDESDMEY